MRVLPTSRTPSTVSRPVRFAGIPAPTLKTQGLAVRGKRLCIIEDNIGFWEPLEPTDSKSVAVGKDACNP